MITNQFDSNWLIQKDRLNFTNLILTTFCCLWRQFLKPHDSSSQVMHTLTLVYSIVLLFLLLNSELFI